MEALWICVAVHSVVAVAVAVLVPDVGKDVPFHAVIPVVLTSDFDSVVTGVIIVVVVVEVEAGFALGITCSTDYGFTGNSWIGMIIWDQVVAILDYVIVMTSFLL